MNFTRVGTLTPLATTVARADAPKLFEYNDIRWELEAFDGGTRLMLGRNSNRHFISWGAAGWHISFDALEQFLAGESSGRIVGADAIKFGWQRLNAEYAERFDIETLNWSSQTAQSW